MSRDREREEPDARSVAERLVFDQLDAAAQRWDRLDLAALCAEHPDLAEQLRSVWEDYQAGLRALGPDGLMIGERYEIRQTIDVGGMGAIHAVWDRELWRTLAMKVVRGNARNVDRALWRRRQSRLRNEAQVLGQLVHPGIVPIHDVGETACGDIYFTMQLIKGQHLGAIIEASRRSDPDWPMTRLVTVLHRVCEAVAHAHSKGVVHRDLKPANVMVGPFGETYVMDWGLAKAVGTVSDPGLPSTNGEPGMAPTPAEAGVGAASSLVHTDRGEVSDTDPDSALRTVAGEVVGTPSYMSPEQARGNIDELDTRTDVYGAGAILYHVLTGQRPYATTDEAPGDLVRAVLAGPPEPIDRIARGVPPELVAICERAMARSPDERYPAMRAMADDLRAFLEDRVVRAHRTGPWVELSKWIRRNKAVATTLGVALVSLASTLILQQQANTRIEEQAKALRRRVYYNDITLAYLAYRRDDIQEMHQLLARCPDDQRGWEWHYLERLSDTSDETLHVPGEAVGIAAVSLNAGLMATLSARDAGPRTTVRIWDASTAQSLHRWISPHWPLHVDFDATGRRLFAAAGGVLDAATGEVLQPAPWGGCWPALALSPDRRLVLASGDGRLRIWSAQALAPVAELDRGFFAMSQVAWSADGRTAVGACRDEDRDGGRVGTVRVYDIARGVRRHKLAGHTAWVESVAASPDGSWVASGGRDGRVIVWDADTGSRMHELPYRGSVWAVVACSPDGRRLVSAAGPVALVWNTQSWRLVERLVGHTGAIEIPRFLPDGRAVTPSRDGSSKIWTLGLPRRALELEVHRTSVLAMAAKPDSSEVAISFGEGPVEIWDVRTRQRVRTTAIPSDRTFLSFTPGGERLLAADRSGRIATWSPEDSQAHATKQAHHAPCVGIEAHPSEPVCVTSGSDGNVRLWDLATLRPRWTVQVGTRAWPPGAQRCRFTPDGRHVAVGANDGRLRILDAATGSLVRELRCDHEANVYHVDGFSNDSRYVVGSSHRGTTGSRVAMWEVATGRLVWMGLGRGSYVFTADGSRVLEAGGTVRVRDAATGKPIVAFEDDPIPVGDSAWGRVKDIVRLADGTIVVGTAAGTLRFYVGQPRSR